MAKIYRKVYRDEVKAIGADAAYFLAELRAYAEFCQKMGHISEDGFFELPSKKVLEMTGYADFKQKQIINDLIRLGAIERKTTNKARFVKLLGAELQPLKACFGVGNATPQGRKCNPIGAEMQPHHIIIKHLISLLISI